MNTPTARRASRAVAAVLAAGLAALTFAAPAHAASPNLVDPDATGSLTIHKYEAPVTPVGLPHDGTEQTVDLPALAGVGFSVFRIDAIDLTTNAGWRDASALSDAFDGTDQSITDAGHTITPVGGERLTDAAGEIALTGLDLGLYYVVETSPLAGSTGVAPFLVTVPLTDPVDDDAWLYDVHVYPKNALTAVEKTVEDSEDVSLGDEVEFTLTADIPNVSVIDGYKLVDDFAATLDYVGASLALSDGTALVEGVDYTVTPAAATAGGPVVEIVFTAAGRDVLEAHTDLRVVAVLTATVNAVGEIVNTALLYPNAGSFAIEPGRPGGPTETPEVITKWGGLTVQKVDESGDALTGAVFSVYATEQDAQDGTNPLTLGGATEFAVAADGTVTISGIRYSDWADGAAVAAGEDGYRTYWLAEIVAPDGFELLAAPIEFTVTAATTAVGVDLEVVNVPSNVGFELPNTGGTGTAVFWLGGSMLLAGAVFLAVYARRKARATA